MAKPQHVRKEHPFERGKPRVSFIRNPHRDGVYTKVCREMGWVGSPPEMVQVQSVGAYGCSREGLGLRFRVTVEAFI